MAAEDLDIVEGENTSELRLMNTRTEPRFPCVGMELMYSPQSKACLDGVGRDFERVAARDISLSGLSFETDRPLGVGETLLVMVQNPGGDPERLVTEVRWCRPADQNGFQVGVKIVALAEETDQGATVLDFVGRGLQTPVGFSLHCPACRRPSTFDLVGAQDGDWEGIMPLYNCGDCGSTRALPSILAHNRQQQVAANSDQPL